MSNQDFILALHRQLITLGVAVHRDSLETAVANALRTAGTTVEQGWQPIETAPRDRTPVQIAHEYNDHDVVSIGTFYNNGWWKILGVDFVKPIAWRPLPAGPGAQAMTNFRSTTPPSQLIASAAVDRPDDQAGKRVATSPIELKPGWLIEDVRKASRRLREWQKQRGPA